MSGASLRASALLTASAWNTAAALAATQASWSANSRLADAQAQSWQAVYDFALVPSTTTQG